MRARRLRSFSVLLASFFLAAPLAHAETLVIGMVLADAKKGLKELEPLAAYLAPRLRAAGIDKVDVTVLPTSAEMIEAFKGGRVHLYAESPLTAAKVGSASGAVPLLRRWRKGVPEYWGEIVVRADSPVTSPADLRGRVIAFDDPDSTSGHLLPRALLIDSGLKVANLERPDAEHDPATVGGVFTTGDKTALLWLLDGRVDAAAVDMSYVQQVEKEQPGTLRSIARSITVPRNVIMRASDMPAERVTLIAAVLSRMSEEEEGRQVLSQFGKTDRFDAFPAGVEATFEPIRARLRVLENEHAVPTH